MSTEFISYPNKSSAFHIHLDAAHLPASLEEYAKSQYGFFDDDFEHELTVQSGSGFRARPARQLTLKIADRLARKHVQEICEDIRARAQCEGFEGLIQSEYVMNEDVISGVSAFASSISQASSFFVHMRKVNPEIGEDFKTHELHLEFQGPSTSSALIQELSRSGMQVSFGYAPNNEITYTAAGDLNKVRQLQKGLLSYLARSDGFTRAKLTLEATVFHSLHRMRSEDTPLLIDRIEYFH